MNDGAQREIGTHSKSGSDKFEGLPVRPMPCLSRVPRPVRAFTLTELLVVIAIIAILMALLVAFYRPSQEQRKVFECQNRLQVFTAPCAFTCWIGKVSLLRPMTP
jgi:prepilin-type N-terminal cleavage/methylation domain-containing protein